MELKRSIGPLSLLEKIREIRVAILHCIHMVLKLNKNLISIFAIAGTLPPLVFRIIDWYHGHPMSSLASFGISILTSVTSTIIISCGVVSVIIYLQREHPWEHGILKRLTLEILLTTVTACGLIVALTILMLPIAPKADLQSAIFNYLIVALIMNFALVAITEGIHFYRRWKHSALEAEKFKAESIRAQLESLKNQVNPHFLFNSLNTLSGLIDYDSELSKEFVDNLSTVYRYVLEHKDEEVVRLRTEIEFIEAFTQLLLMRHGRSIGFHISISDKDLDGMIPPMTLQLLVENAVKHNVASKKRPLSIEIFSQEKGLVVRNNLQRKKNVNSTGIGLNNVISRYHYLSDEQVIISETQDVYEVKIPIIKYVRKLNESPDHRR